MSGTKGAVSNKMIRLIFGISTQGAVMRKMIVAALILFAHEGYVAPCSPFLNRAILKQFS